MGVRRRLVEQLKIMQVIAEVLGSPGAMAAYAPRVAGAAIDAAVGLQFFPDVADVVAADLQGYCTPSQLIGKPRRRLPQAVREGVRRRYSREMAAAVPGNLQKITGYPEMRGFKTMLVMECSISR